MPVLIILLYYINDLSTLKRYYDQTEFVAQQIVNILQNTAKKRVAENKFINTGDVVKAAKAAYLSIYPGTMMYHKYSEFFHVPRLYVYYVEKNSDGTASVKWGKWFHTVSSSLGKFNLGNTGSGTVGSTITQGKEVEPSVIYPTLKMGESPKIIIETQLLWLPAYKNSKGKSVSSAREVFGCYLVNPKFHASDAYFPAVVIFSPYGGFSPDGLSNE